MKSTIRIRITLLFLLAGLAGCARTDKHFTPAGQQRELTQIRQVMAAQEQAWNRADLEAYMEGYWKSDSLAFIGSRGLTYGWQQTLANYRKSYPDKEAMGKLQFTLLRTELITFEAAYVVGKWHLQRSKGDLEGHFSLLWRIINGRWVIVSDHSS